MAEQLREDGVYRGTILDSAVGLTRNGATQFQARLLSTQRFDKIEKEWEDFADYTVEAYLPFRSKNGEYIPFASKDLKSAFGFDDKPNTSLLTVLDQDFNGKTVQFVVKWETWQGNTRLKVSSIRAEDAPVGFRRLSAEDKERIAKEDEVNNAPIPADAEIPF